MSKVRYHINARGEAGPCRAMNACPFGDMNSDHYDTPEAARAGFEAKMKNEASASSFGTVSRSPRQLPEPPRDQFMSPQARAHNAEVRRLREAGVLPQL